MLLTKYYEADIMELFSNEGHVKSFIEGFMEGFVEGFMEGLARGRAEILIPLVKDGIISSKEAAHRMNVSIAEFNDLLNSKEQ